MPGYSDSKCSECGKFCSPELLVIKRTTFATRSNPRKIIKMRTPAWKCPACLKLDPDWNLEQYEAPGHRSDPLERVRNAKS